MNIEQAIEECKKGNIQALGIIFSEYHLGVFKTVYLVAKNKSMAEDITQEVFIRLFEQIGSYDINRSFKPWLYRLAVNLALNALKKNRELINSDPAGNKIAASIDQEMKIIIQEAIKKLPCKQRVAIILKYYEDFTDNEISFAMDCSIGTVKSRIFLAKRKLQAILKDWEIGTANERRKHDKREVEPSTHQSITR